MRPHGGDPSWKPGYDRVPHPGSSQMHPQYSHGHYEQYPATMSSSSPPSSFLESAFPHSHSRSPQYSYGRNFNRMNANQGTVDNHEEFLYSARPSENRNYNANNDRHMYEREYPSQMGYHYQRNVQFVEEDERYTKPGCIRRSFNDVLDLLFPKYRRGRSAKATYPVVSPRDQTRFKSSAIHSFDIPERHGSFDSNGSIERARQFMRDVSHRTSDKASELHDQLRAMVQERALRQTQAREASIPSTPLEDERLAESRRMLQLQIEQHQAAMTNHIAAMQTQQQHFMPPMKGGSGQNGMVNGMLNHHQLNNMFTSTTSNQEKMAGMMPQMNYDGVQRDNMGMLQCNTSPRKFYHQQQQDQRDPSECTPRSNDRSTGNKQRNGVNFASTHSTAGSLSKVVRVANGTKIVFAERKQHSDASTIQSIQESVDRAMRKSDAARRQKKTSHQFWNQASKIRA